MACKIYSTELQFLTIQVVNSHGLNDDGFVIGLDQDGDAATFAAQGLQRLVLVCLTIPAWGVHIKQIYPFNSPLSVSRFLAEQWCKAEGVFSLPQVIEVSKAFAAADTGLFAWLEGLGIEVVVGSDRNKRSLASFERCAKQYLTSEFTFCNEDRLQVVVALERANASLDYYSRFGVEIFHAHNASSVTEQFKSFQVRQRRWLDSNARPVEPSDMKLDSLLIRKVNRPPTELRIDRATVYSDEDEACIDDLKAALACWPVSKDAMRAWTSISTQELSWFFSRKSLLDRRKLYQLYEYLYVDVSGDHPDFMGGNVVLANGLANIDLVINALTHGGDQLAFFEVSNSAEISNRWRIALLWGWSGLPSAILFERGSKEAKRLDGKHWPEREKWFYNFQGQREVRPSLANDLRWALEHLDQLDGFGKFGSFLDKKHGEYLYTREFQRETLSQHGLS